MQYLSITQPDDPAALVALNAAVSSAKGELAVKEARATMLPGAYDVDVTVRIVGQLSIGLDTDAACGQTPEPAKLLAYVMSKLNDSTRAALLRDLPTLFAEGGNEYPAVDALIVAEATSLQAQLRAKMPRIAKRGQVTSKLTLSAAEMRTSALPLAG